MTKPMLPKSELRKYKLSEYPFISEAHRDRYFKDNPQKLTNFDNDEKLCINIRWDLILKPKSILQCRRDGEWIIIWKNGNAKKSNDYSRGSMMNLNGL